MKFLNNLYILVKNKKQSKAKASKKMSTGNQLVKAFNSLSQELKDEFIEKLYNIYYEKSRRKEEFYTHEEWDFEFDCSCMYYISRNEKLFNAICSKVVQENILGYCNECEAELADGYWWSRPERNLKFCADCGEYVLKEEAEEQAKEEAVDWNDGTHPCECCEGFDNTRFYEKSNQIWCEHCADQVSCKECRCLVFEEDTEGGLCGNCVVKMKHEQWNNKHPYTDRDFSISGYCQKCEAKCETIDDILCHYCYHHSLEDNEECWCCNK